MGNVSSVLGRHIMDYTPALCTRVKNMLLGGSDVVSKNDGPAGVNTHLRIPIVGTTVASTYSLLLVVSGVVVK